MSSSPGCKRGSERYCGSFAHERATSQSNAEGEDQVRPNAPPLACFRLPSDNDAMVIAGREASPSADAFGSAQAARQYLTIARGRTANEVTTLCRCFEIADTVLANRGYSRKWQTAFFDAHKALEAFQHLGVDARLVIKGAMVAPPDCRKLARLVVPTREPARFNTMTFLISKLSRSLDGALARGAESV